MTIAPHQPLFATVRTGAIPAAIVFSEKFAVSTLRGWHRPDLIEWGEVVVAALVEHAVAVHRDAIPIVIIEVTLQLTTTTIGVDVWDPHPTPLPNHPGLARATAASTRVGYFHPATGGKTIRAELDAAVHGEHEEAGLTR